MIKKLSILFLILAAVFSLTACDSIGNTQNGSGDLALSIADKPVNNVAQVLVTIDEVQVKKEDAEWETINGFDENGGEKEFDLITLKFKEELLGQETLEAGFYNQIRLIVAADDQNSDPTTVGKSKVVYDDGSEDNIFIPSGTQTGLKINHNFEIRDGVITKLLLDVNVSEIMHQAGASDKIILRPTAIDIIDELEFGSILGKVIDADGNYSFENDVVVEVYNNEDTIADADPINSTVAAAKATENEEAGTFLIRGLEAGTYKLNAYTADENGDPLENSLNGTLEDVEVIKGEKTDLIVEDRNIMLESNVE